MRVSVLHLLVIYFMLLSSCSTKDDHKNILYQSFANEIDNMRRFMKNSSVEILAELDNKRTEPSTRYKAEIWYTKAIIIQKLTDTAIGYIKELEKELNLPTTFPENEKETVKAYDKKVFADILSGKRQMLYDRLVAYNKNVLNVDNLIKVEFEKDLVVFSDSNEDAGNKQEAANYFFDGISAGEASLLLRHLENNLRFIENRTIQFCAEHVGSTDGWSMYRQFSTIIGLSSSVIKKGETVEITAGVGSFSLSVAPIITINGKKIQFDEDGAARYKLTQNFTAGKKTVIVRFEYTDQEGKKLWLIRLFSTMLLNNDLCSFLSMMMSNCLLSRALSNVLRMNVSGGGNSSDYEFAGGKLMRDLFAIGKFKKLNATFVAICHRQISP